MTAEQCLQLQRARRISVRAVGEKRWNAGVIVSTADPHVFSYEQAEGSDPLEVVEMLCKRMGWMDEAQGSLFQQEAA